MILKALATPHYGIRIGARALVTMALVVAGLTLFAATPSSALEIKRMKLSNGATLLVAEQHALPMVTMAISFDAGSRRDPKGKEGLASLTAQCLTQGTSSLTADQFNEKTDFMGSSVSVDATSDYAEASLTSLKKYEDETLHLLVETLQSPALHDADIARKRAEQVAAINAQMEEPDYVANVTFSKALFGDGPYGHPVEGTADSVAKLSDDDVRNFYRDQYKLGSAIIVVAGDVNAEDIKAKLEKEFTGLAGTVAPQAVFPAPMVPPGLHTDLVDRDISQANIIIGAGGVARSNPDFYKLQVMNYILGGGGFASRLMKTVRSKAGLAYSIDSGFRAGLFPGAFLIALQTKNQSADEAIRITLEQMRQIQNAPVSDSEIESAKKYLIGAFPLKLDRQSQIVSFILQTEIYGLGTDYIERYPKIIQAITKEDVQQVAQKYLHPDALILVAVADQKVADIKPAAFEKP